MDIKVEYKPGKVQIKEYFVREVMPLEAPDVKASVTEKISYTVNPLTESKEIVYVNGRQVSGFRDSSKIKQFFDRVKLAKNAFNATQKGALTQEQIDEVRNASLVKALTAYGSMSGVTKNNETVKIFEVKQDGSIDEVVNK